MTARLLVVAGAAGALGGAVVREAARRGWRVRAFVRNPDNRAAALHATANAEIVTGDARDPEAAAAAMRGADAVFSSVGASVMPGLGRGWRGYGAVDVPANASLIEAAVAASVPRFVYVSCAHAPALRSIAYIDAHERVVDQLRAAPLAWAVVRPTGLFSAVTAYLDMARKGALPEIGDGRARSNPIADDDLARVCVDALESAEPRLELDAGGPDILTRHDFGELAFAALGRRPRFRRVPAWLARVGAALLRPLHPRMSQIASFITAISTHDVIAAPRGRTHLADHFATLAAHAP